MNHYFYEEEDWNAAQYIGQETNMGMPSVIQHRIEVVQHALSFIDKGEEYPGNDLSEKQIQQLKEASEADYDKYQALRQRFAHRIALEEGALFL